MSKIILHHYPLSPYSEKVRLALGLKGISWNSVEIPVWTPRPKLTPMTGGYRRTPILQIGAEFYCDTLHIFASSRIGRFRRALSKRTGRPGQGFRLVDREGILLERRVSHDRQHARNPPRACRRTAPVLSASTWIPQSCVPSERCICSGSMRISPGLPKPSPMAAISSSGTILPQPICRPITRSGLRGRMAAARSRS